MHNFLGLYTRSSIELCFLACVLDVRLARDGLREGQQYWHLLEPYIDNSQRCSVKALQLGTETLILFKSLPYIPPITL